MKRAILLVVLASSGAMAQSLSANDWRLVGTGDKVEAFIHDASVRVVNGQVRAWSLTVYAAPQQFDGMTFLSTKTLSKYNCAEGWTSLMQITYLAGSRGVGDVIRTTTLAADDQHFPSPGTVGASLMDEACKASKRK